MKLKDQKETSTLLIDRDKPDMSFAVGFGGECVFTDQTLERPLSIVCAQMAYQRALIGARVLTQVTFIWRQTQMRANVT